MTQFHRAFFFVSGLLLASCADMDRFSDGSRGGGSDGYGLGNSERVGDLRPLSDEEAEFIDVIGDHVYFAVDENTLSPQARQVLTEQADWLIRNPGYTVLIEGHADERGTQEYNLALGARRASSVQQFLIARGIAPQRLDIVTLGKERPVEICSAESCYSRNRRAVTVLLVGTS